MAIGTVTSLNAAHLYGVNSKRAKKAPEQKTALSPREEQVELSAESKKAQESKELAKIAEKAPEVRIPLVEELKAKIKSNDYPIENKLDDLVRTLIQRDPFSTIA